MPRTYKLRRRAKRQEETRLRIVEATISLHQTLGGLNTTISAIAERAGVERATVYRHFPDERALLQACTGHYFTQHPPPNPEDRKQIAAPEERLRTGLAQVYAYHRSTEVMSARAAIDIPQIPLLREVLTPMFAYWGSVRDALVEPWPIGEEDARLPAAVGHAISFQTWQSLVREHGLTDADAVALMVGMVRCAARS